MEIVYDEAALTRYMEWALDISPGKPVLAPAGMRGDRAQVVFSGLDDLKRFLVAS